MNRSTMELEWDDSGRSNAAFASSMRMMPR